MQYPNQIGQLIESFSKLPGVGRKTATRYAFHILSMNDNDASEFSQSIQETKNAITFCSVCGFITSKDMDPCAIDRDQTRDQTKIFVVKDSQAVMSIDNLNDYRGLYHVLNGVINPLAGIGPENINVTSLINRLKQHPEVNEVIIGLDSSAEGEATTLYLARLIKPAGIKVSTLARGLSVGSDLNYADKLTLSRAVTGRTEL
ncbi:MAG: recombination mediator RecR [Lactobacillaceae bacterium]|jgi:recombination protein RecR|nr:recombination mediator RecR [Lactobacillaceae bacterium]